MKATALFACVLPILAISCFSETRDSIRFRELVGRCVRLKAPLNLLRHSGGRHSSEQYLDRHRSEIDQVVQVLDVGTKIKIVRVVYEPSVENTTVRIFGRVDGQVGTFSMDAVCSPEWLLSAPQKEERRVVQGGADDAVLNDRLAEWCDGHNVVKVWAFVLCNVRVYSPHYVASRR